jgi:hypothetical protein
LVIWSVIFNSAELAERAVEFTIFVEPTTTEERDGKPTSACLHHSLAAFMLPDYHFINGVVEARV